MSWLKGILFGTTVGDKALAALERHTGLAVVEVEELREQIDEHYGATAKGRDAVREGRRGSARKDT